MRLLPFYQETLVLPFQQEETARKLRQVTRPLDREVEYTEVTERGFLFNGWIKNNRFRISRKVQHPQNFLPLMMGRIEGTSAGSILFIRYGLFFSSAMFLVFWSVISLALSLLFLFAKQMYLYASVSLGLGIINYIVATKNFHLQVRTSRKTLDDALNKALPFPPARKF